MLAIDLPISRTCFENLAASVLSVNLSFVSEKVDGVKLKPERYQ